MSIVGIPCIIFFYSVNAHSALQLKQFWLMVCALMCTRHKLLGEFNISDCHGFRKLQQLSFGISRVSLWRQPGENNLFHFST